MKTDIKNRNDVVLMVDTFYKSVQENQTLGYIFNDVAKINWSEHLPKMYSFWARILLDEHSYSGNPMVKHIALSKTTSISETEFNEWILLFTKTVDDLFEGENATEAKVRAGNIARLMLHKIQSA